MKGLVYKNMTIENVQIPAVFLLMMAVQPLNG